MSRDPRYLLETIGHYDRSDTELLSIGYTRDSAGNPLSIGGQEYTYDANNRLDSWVNNADYNYDWVGNRLNPPASPNEMVYNAADQLVTWPGQHTYDYLGTGSLYHQYDSTGLVTQKTYTYTEANLLQSVAHAGLGTSSMTWDADGNRITFTSSTNMGNAHAFVYDTTAGIPAVMEELKPTGAPGGAGPVYYIREPNGALIARVEGETTHYYHFDALGSTRLLTGASGTVTDQYSYDAWGNMTSQSGSTAQPYRYVGQLGYYSHYQDANLPLLQLGVRFYDPALGRFTQVDPIASVLSMYPYCRNAPVRYVDPSGMFWCEPVAWLPYYECHWGSRPPDSAGPDVRVPPATRPMDRFADSKKAIDDSDLCGTICLSACDGTPDPRFFDMLRRMGIPPDRAKWAGVSHCMKVCDVWRGLEDGRPSVWDTIFGFISDHARHIGF